MNIQLTESLVEKLVAEGVCTFVVCAGARNAPFVKVLSSAKDLEVHYFYDERSAAFFALGRVKADGHPVVVVTTSGTAAAETLPAVIEAHYTRWPLIIVTADRPRSYRGKGAPQSIDQVGLFSHYVEKCHDIAYQKEVPSFFGLGDQPVHINVCFDEPLIDQHVQEKTWNPTFEAYQNRKSVNVHPLLKSFVRKHNKPLILISELDTSERGLVAEFLNGLNVLCYLECGSGLSTDIPGPVFIQSGASALQKLKLGQDYDCVIRIGGVPTARFWRDLEDNDTPVLNISRRPFSGSSRVIQSPEQIEVLFGLREFTSHWESPSSDFKDLEERRHLALQKVIENRKTSEVGWIQQLLQTIPEGSDLFVGNSLPIRELDLLYSKFAERISVHTNRGANGIDGLISTAFGMGQQDREMWILLGDLSALYDLNALSQVSDTRAKKVRVVVINNGGGKIFNRMFKDKHFENRHEWNFKSWAEQFGFAYSLVHETQPLTISILQSSSLVIEIKPNEEESDHFWTEYEGIFK